MNTHGGLRTIHASRRPGAPAPARPGANPAGNRQLPSPDRTLADQVGAPRRRNQASEEGTPVTQAPDVVITFPLTATETRRGDNTSGTARHTAPSPLRPSRAPRVSVVVPTFNEARNLPEIMNRIPAEYEVVIVDGRSVDDTVDVAKRLRPDATIVLQNRRGKGNAMACGFAAVTGDIVVMLDADGSAAPEEISRFVDALLAGADFAKGSRFAPGGGSSDITPMRAWGNAWLNRFANVLFGTRYTDLCYGYNAFWRDCLEDLQLDPRHEASGGKLWGDGFEIETIINTRMAKARMRITEVPSFESARVHGESNLNTWRDGFRVLRALLIERVNGVGRPGHRNIARPMTFTDDVVPDPRRPGTAEVRSA